MSENKVMDSSTEIIEKPISELPPDLDFYAEGKWPQNWSYGTWANGDMDITNALPDGSEIRYRIPQVLVSIMRRERKVGIEEFQASIRGMLNID